MGQPLCFHCDPEQPADNYIIHISLRDGGQARLWPGLEVCKATWQELPVLPRSRGRGPPVSLVEGK